MEGSGAAAACLPDGRNLIEPAGGKSRRQPGRLRSSTIFLLTQLLFSIVRK